jgi:hypothetical protein
MPAAILASFADKKRFTFESNERLITDITVSPAPVTSTISEEPCIFIILGFLFFSKTIRP